MRRSPRLVLFGTLVALIGGVTSTLSPLLAAQAQAKPQAHAPLNAEAIEVFLTQARITKKRNAGAGVTDSARATLTDGRLTHDAQIQAVDITKDRFEAGKASEVNFRDSYRYNIAAYRVSRLLGMDNVPVSVERRVDGKPAAMTWWLDDVLMTEKERLTKSTMGPEPLRTSRQLQMMYVFDELIQNKDRNVGNIVWTKDWKLWLIDHTRAFRTGKELAKPEELQRCERGFFQKLRALTPIALEQVTEAVLTSAERDALLARRDLLVMHYEDRISRSLDANVLFDW